MCVSYVLRPQAGTGTVYESGSSWQSTAFMVAWCCVAAALGLVLVSLAGSGSRGASVFLQVASLEPSFVAAEADGSSATDSAANTADVAVAAITESSDAPGQDLATSVDESASVQAAGNDASGAVSAASNGPLAGRTIWSNGDSTSYFMSLWVLGAMEGLGAVPVHDAEYWQSSGLTSPNFFDWPGYIEEQMTLYDPEIVVFMVGTNDIDPALNLTEYGRTVGEQMDALVDREVYWVGVPSFDPGQRPDLAGGAPAINNVFIAEAASRPWVTYVDVIDVTTDEDGNYARTLPTVTGEDGELRASDGIHFTSAGGRVMAANILRAIQSR
jgi:hypothetical protein